MTPSNTPADTVLITLRRVIRAVDNHSRTLAEQHGLTVPQLMVLQEIARQTEPSLVEIAHGVSLSKATVASILDRLDRGGKIRRVRSPWDRRRLVVTLTEEGQTLLQAAPPLLHERFVAAYTGLKDWEQSLILSSLQRVANMLDASELDAAPMLAPGSVSTPLTTPIRKIP